MTTPEYTDVEKPFLEQLRAMGWRVIEDTGGDLHGRKDYREVLLLDILREKLCEINLNRHGQVWLDELRIDDAVNALRNPDTRKPLLDLNEHLTNLLIKGITVAGEEGERDYELQYFDWNNIQNNDFLAISQFRVNRIGGMREDDHVIPDIVLFVNGIPLVVIECKSPYLTDPLGDALEQLRRYMNMRGTEVVEGAVQLFYTNLFCVATDYWNARLGAAGAPSRFWLEWKDVAPLSKLQVMQELGRDNLDAAQLTLIAGALRPAHLLDILRHFVIFQDVDGNKIKVIPRYHQYRAVHYAVRRLAQGKVRRKSDFNRDERGGVIWHTQGSGKSLTMVYLVRFMRTMKGLTSFKVVVVTDRKDLQKQLSETMAYTDQSVELVTNGDALKKRLSRDGSELIFAMIQKYGVREGIRLEDIEKMDALNDSEDILVLVDEAHRSHSGTLHAIMERLLPNAAHIGFTGTPLIVEGKKHTADIFGQYIDTYTIRESEADGMTIPLLYELRAPQAQIGDGDEMDSLFEELMEGYSLNDKDRIQREIARQDTLLEADDMIRAKAVDMLRHYAQTIMPNGFKAMVVAVSRRAAVNYQKALTQARDELISELAAISPDNIPAADSENDDERFIGTVYPHLERLKRLDFAAIISPGADDDPSWFRWSDERAQDNIVERFKAPLDKDGMAFLCVQRMLITGFDAPVAQVLYLDRFSQNHELLQTIARVNRTAAGKDYGYIVDYYGIPQELKAALTAYSTVPNYLDTVLRPFSEEIGSLIRYHREVLQLFEENGINDIHETERCVLLFRNDMELRARFVARLKRFLTMLDVVLPRAEALPYVADAKQLSRINIAASRLYRDSQLDIREMGAKVRKLIDDYLVVHHIDRKVPPISIMADDFVEIVQQHTSDEAQAAEMEHAADYHINVHYAEDPAYYRRLSERLTNILERYSENVELRVQALLALTEEVRHGREEDSTGLDRNTQLPFYDILKEATTDEWHSVARSTLLVELTIQMVDYLSNAIQEVGFWDKPGAQRSLHSWLVRFLDTQSLVAFEKQETTADLIIETAWARRQSLNHD